MSAHVKVWRGYSCSWCWACLSPRCDGYGLGFSLRHPTHAEALAAAWAHIKEHS